MRAVVELVSALGELRRCGSVALRDVADDLRELERTRPHGPVTGRQVDPGDVTELVQAGKPRVALFHRVLVLLRREPRADQRARDVEAGGVCSLHDLPPDATPPPGGSPPGRR